jgi:hypothetical protein
MVEFLYKQDYDINVTKIEEEDKHRKKINHLVEAFYQKDYDTNGKKNEEKGKRREDDHLDFVLRHIRVNAVADYYDLPLLKARAPEKMETAMAMNWDAHRFLDVVAEGLRTTSDTGLHDALAMTATAHSGELLKLEGFGSSYMSPFALRVVETMYLRDKHMRALATNRLKDLLDREGWGDILEEHDDTDDVEHYDDVEDALNKIRGAVCTLHKLLSPATTCDKCSGAPKNQIEKVNTVGDKTVHTLHCALCHKKTITTKDKVGHE